MDILFLVIALGLLIALSFTRLSIMLVAPLVTAVLVIMTGDMPWLYALTGPFMSATAGYVQSFFLIFLGGALFGKIMGESGGARSIALFIARKLGKGQAVLAVVLATALLTYGGVSLFVAVFAIFPLAQALFVEANIPKRLIPATIALGAFTFTMTALPGSPQSINALPTNPLGTNIFAAPILGVLGAVIIVVFGLIWLGLRVKAAKKTGEGYGEVVSVTATTDDSNLPSFWVALAPLLVIFILNFVLVRFVFIDRNEGIMARFAPFGGLNNNWPLIIALFSGILLSLFLFRKQIGTIDATLSLVSRGAESSLLPLFNTALIIGFGGVVKLTGAFEVIKQFIFGLEIPGLFKVAISTGMLSAITGSSSGGAGIALEAFKDQFLAMGLNPEAIHRVMLVAAGGLDTLPHCGAVVTLLGVCAVSPRKSYADIGMVTVVGPLIATIAMIGFHLTTGLV